MDRGNLNGSDTSARARLIGDPPRKRTRERSAAPRGIGYNRAASNDGEPCSRSALRSSSTRNKSRSCDRERERERERDRQREPRRKNRDERDDNERSPPLPLEFPPPPHPSELSPYYPPPSPPFCPVVIAAACSLRVRRMRLHASASVNRVETTHRGVSRSVRRIVTHTLAQPGRGMLQTAWPLLSTGLSPSCGDPS